MSKPGGIFSFNINDGFLEGVVRGFKLGLLTQADYSNLIQCETLDGMSLYFLCGLHFLAFQTFKTPSIRLNISFFLFG
jgi:V-type H+-transporting ATPase subunit d